MSDPSLEPIISPKSRMWLGLFGVALLANLAYFAIGRHELIGKGSSLLVSPVMGIVVGGVEIVLAIYVLIAWAWTGFRDMRAKGKEKPVTRI